MKLDEIRNEFLKYFKEQAHEVVPSSSLIPANDPTLLFTNAGMNQFKDVFLGIEKRPYSRACSSQKCFRASGKHNDLENVGFTARHHTFFEMLGNFSFGEYFKREAIFFAWDFLVNRMGLDKKRIWVTIYKEDDEAFKLWQEVCGIPKERIVRMGEKDNFWSMGDTGPCGPCSELIFDQGEGVGCEKPSCGVECDCDRYLELWNLVFMQFERDKEGKMKPLPKPSIDTGMGLERITAVIQGVPSNYEIDHFKSIIARIDELGAEGGEDAQKIVSKKVIADHSRAIAFLIADGILPSNEGRGYVLRRVIRRAARHSRLLGFSEPMLYKIADRVIDLMGSAYPELKERRTYIGEVIRNEEERFLETIDSGLKLLEEETEKHKKEKKPWIFPGELAFKLYDTYGFPLDLTQSIGREKGFEVDLAGFEKEMEKQRERARAHWKGSGDEEVERIYKELLAEGIRTKFLGYEMLRCNSRISALIFSGKRVKEVSAEGAEFQIITVETPFYGESGGQVGDKGTARTKDSKATIFDTVRPLEGLIVLKARLEKGVFREQEEVELEVDEKRRIDTARNHSATHLLQAALREILGDHVQQKGSLVEPERLRFDFTHFSPLSQEEIIKVERRVNELIRENLPVRTEIVDYRSALAKGAMALFGEKYGDRVRLVEMGDFSKELCGGTHISRTGEIGLFKIVSEAGVSAGVRRIEAVSGRAGVEYVQGIERVLKEISSILGSPVSELMERIKKLNEENRELKRALKEEQRAKSKPDIDKLLNQAEERNGIKILVAEVQARDNQHLLELSDEIFNRLGRGVLVLGAKDSKKAYLLAKVSKDLLNSYKASELIRAISPIVGGKGGGRADIAQGGGTKPDALSDALNEAKSIISKRIF